MSNPKYCAICGAEFERRYYTYRDNFMQVKYFDELDGSDNAFCSKECAGEALSLEEVYITEDDNE